MTEEFEELRPSAFAMLGSVSEAEDVVQEGFLRLHRAREGGERIESPRAYLSTVVSRLSLDHLRSARDWMFSSLAPPSLALSPLARPGSPIAAMSPLRTAANSGRSASDGSCSARCRSASTLTRVG